MVDITCVLTSHEKPRLVHEAIGSVLCQTHRNWELVVMDSGQLMYTGAFASYAYDKRIKVLPTGQTKEMVRSVCLLSRAINLAWEYGAVHGELVCYLCDDDVFSPFAFWRHLQFKKEHPEAQAWYGTVDRSEFQDNKEGEKYLSTLKGDVLGGVGGRSLNCYADGMQACHVRSLHVPWPLEPEHAWHCDGLWLERLGEKTPILPMGSNLGRHRHTPHSNFTRPSDPLVQNQTRYRCPGRTDPANTTKGLVEMLRELPRLSRVVEVGSYEGVSSEVFALLCEKVWCVDSYFQPAFYERMKSYPNIEPMHATSEAAARYVPDASLDLVYIDADHTYESARDDLKLWVPKVKPGGWVAGHDYTWEFPGVIQAVAERFRYPERVYPDSSWIVRLP